MSGYLQTKKIAGIGAFLVLAAILLIPALALAVPGSGEFVGNYSSNGREMTELYNLIAKICLGILVIVEGVLIFSIIAFRRRSDDDRPVQNHGNLRLEAGWTLAALVVQIWIGVATIDVMFNTEVPPEQVDMTVVAEASQWDWDFYYEFPDDDGREPFMHQDLVVPAHANINLLVTSRDVIHSLYVPELGIKMDAVPGRNNRWWFRADGPISQVRAPDFATINRPDRTLPQTRSDRMQNERYDLDDRPVSGLEKQVSYLGATREVGEISPYANYNAIEYQGVCAELCGRDHWDMYFRAVVMTQSSFDNWVDDKLNTVSEPVGESIYARRCASCHGDQGGGDAEIPSLVDSERVTNPEMKDDHIQIVLEGKGQMQAFGAILDDAEIAAVVNHERVSWGNDGGEIEADDVATKRDELGMEPRPASAVEPTATGDLMALGERLYQSCTSCHGSDGQSFDPQAVPNVAGSDLVVADDVAPLAEVLIDGRDSPDYPGRKTEVARSMSDLQLASLLTYLRQSFGNEANPVQPFEITEIREEMD